MTELYALAFQLCVAALVPNPHTVLNLPEHQQMYIIKAVEQVCQEETKGDKFLMCVEQKFVPEEC